MTPKEAKKIFEKHYKFPPAKEYVQVCVNKIKKDPSKIFSGLKTKETIKRYPFVANLADKAPVVADDRSFVNANTAEQSTYGRK